jgi:hypothetical protein
MENSPPGIHTMPSDAWPGGDVLFSTVGANKEGLSEGSSGFRLGRKALNAMIVRAAKLSRITVQFRAPPERFRGRGADFDLERLLLIAARGPSRAFDALLSTVEFWHNL